MTRVRENRKSSGSDPFATALRLLTLKDRSCRELVKKLCDRGHSTEAAEATIARCIELGYLNDERFAANRARALVTSGRAVGIKALNDLQRAGIGRQLAEQALAEAEDEADLTRLVDEIRQRRFPDFHFADADEKEKNRVVNFFRRRGFPVAMILDALKQDY